MLKLILITDDPEIAKKAEDSGVDIIMVDLNTIISNHSVESVPKMRQAISTSKLMVRINPLHENSEQEIEQVIDFGADLIMVPMFKTYRELNTISQLVGGRCGLVPLLETTEALLRVDDILKVDNIEFIHLGLNDLKIGLGVKFLFEVVSGGLIEYLGTKINNINMDFGFGGVARMDSGELPGRLVLSEHIRLGSKAVILSRAFHNNSTTIEELNDNVDLSFEINKLREYESKYRSGEVDLNANKIEFKRIVDKIIS